MSQVPTVQVVPVAQAFGGLEHRPVAGSHLPPTWHVSDAPHTVGVPTQTPCWQLSFCVQGLPSLQGALFSLGGEEHAPVAGSQVPATWHWSAAMQVLTLPTQEPAWQVSCRVQGAPSSQEVLSAFAGLEHCPVLGAQVPAV